jgi:hypothetical protein
MVNFAVSWDRSVLNSLRIEILNAPKEIAVYVANEIPMLLRKAITPLTTEPRLPTLPFIWSHDPVKDGALRRAYFKTLPRGSRGGRYVRTHRLVQSWLTAGKITSGGAEASVSNDTPFLDTVQGDDTVQYPSHKDSGWVQYKGVLEEAGVTAVDAIAEKWLGVLDS